MKRCPQCAKRIHDDANRCRFCNHLIEPALPSQQKKASSWQKNVSFSAVILLVVAAGVAFFFAPQADDPKSVAPKDGVAENRSVADRADQTSDTDQSLTILHDAGKPVTEDRRQREEKEALERERQAYEREQQRLERERQEYETAQQRTQQQVQREIQEYEAAQQRKEAELRQRQYDELQRLEPRPRYVYKRYPRR